MVRKRIIQTPEGEKYELRVTYDVVAVKSTKVPSGTIVAKGTYTTEAAAVKAAKKSIKQQKPSPSHEERYKLQTGHALQRKTQLTHFTVDITTKRYVETGQVGGLFVFTYQLNGRTLIHDRYIESYSRRTKEVIAAMDAPAIARKLKEAQEFARIQFLQEVGLETANIVNEEFIPPILFKYYH